MPGGRRHTSTEDALVRQARAFLRARARELEAMLGPARELRDKMAATAAYTQVDGSDDAQNHPLWSLAGELESVLCDEAETLATMLRAAAHEPVARRRGVEASRATANRRASLSSHRAVGQPAQNPHNSGRCAGQRSR